MAISKKQKHQKRNKQKRKEARMQRAARNRAIPFEREDSDEQSMSGLPTKQE